MRKYLLFVLSIMFLIISAQETPCQTLMGWQLDESNTGLAGVGINRDTLPMCDLQPDIYGWLRPQSGAVIRNKRIENPICLVAGNITIERCWIKFTVDPGRGMNAITDLDFNRMVPCTSALTIRDCDIDGTFLADPDKDREGFPSVGSVGTWQRNNIYGVGCGWYTSIGNGVPILVENNYIHDLRTGTTSHDDGLTIRSRSSPATVFRNNRIDAYTIHCTGALFLQATFGYLDSIYIEGNLLEGNGYNLILEWNKNGYGHIYAKNNRFNSRGFGTGYVAGGGGWLGWQDMYLNDSTKADNKGAAVEEPKAALVSDLGAPVNLGAVLQLSNQIHLAWSAVATTENGFRIERSVNGGIFTGIDMSDSGVTVYQDTGLGSGSYRYRVAAYNKSGLSGYSNEVTAQVTVSVNLQRSSKLSLVSALRETISSLYSEKNFSALLMQPGNEFYNVKGTRVNGRGSVCPGVYLIRGKTDGSVTATRK